MTNRRIGIVTAILGGVLLAALAVIALVADGPMGHVFGVGLLVDGLLGYASIKILTDAATVSRIEQMSLSYVDGVRDTVDRLAAALPPEGTD